MYLTSENGNHIKSRCQFHTRKKSDDLLRSKHDNMKNVEMKHFPFQMKNEKFRLSSNIWI